MATLTDEKKDRGRYVAQWDRRDVSGSALSPGAYFVRMQSGDLRAASKVMFSK